MWQLSFWSKSFIVSSVHNTENRQDIILKHTVDVEFTDTFLLVCLLDKSASIHRIVLLVCGIVSPPLYRQDAVIDRGATLLFSTEATVLSLTAALAASHLCSIALADRWHVPRLFSRLASWRWSRFRHSSEKHCQDDVTCRHCDSEQRRRRALQERHN